MEIAVQYTSLQLDKRYSGENVIAIDSEEKLYMFIELRAALYMMGKLGTWERTRNHKMSP